MRLNPGRASSAPSEEDAALEGGDCKAADAADEALVDVPKPWVRGLLQPGGFFLVEGAASLLPRSLGEPLERNEQLPGLVADVFKAVVAIERHGDIVLGVDDQGMDGHLRPSSA